MRQAILDEILKNDRRSSVSRRLASPLIRIAASVPPVRLRAVHFFNVTETIPPFRPGARLLEVGCGSGHFLARMKSKGWEVFGVDMDSRSVEVAKSSYGIDVFRGQLQDARLMDRSFDAIVMKHSIEHISDPKSLLVESLRVLSPGGWMGIITPNVKSLAHRLFAEHWFALEIPRHLYLFSPAVLSECVRASGFEVITTYTQANMARDIYEASVRIRERALGRRGEKEVAGNAQKFGGLERAMLSIYPGCGEEIVLLARRGAEA
jgi:2-polyprenyl-3-methyl-5-hydroxy-6-metoxy-1,4-benzoquinol methylase